MLRTDIRSVDIVVDGFEKITTPIVINSPTSNKIRVGAGAREFPIVRKIRYTKIDSAITTADLIAIVMKSFLGMKIKKAVRDRFFASE